VQHSAGIAFKRTPAQITLPALAAVVGRQASDNIKSVPLRAETSDSSVRPHEMVEAPKLSQGQSACMQLILVD
jgi:hypothetical protein